MPNEEKTRSDQASSSEDDEMATELAGLASQERWKRSEVSHKHTCSKCGNHASPTILLSFATPTYGAKICKIRHKDGDLFLRE